MDRVLTGTIVFQDFGGIEESTDGLKIPPSQVPWMHGLMPLSNHRLQRIPGKKLYDAITTHGSILTIQQLTFANNSGVYLHHGRFSSIVKAMTSLASEMEYSTPMEPFNPLDGGCPV